MICAATYGRNRHRLLHVDEKIVGNGNYQVQFPLNELELVKHKNQIDEYFKFCSGSGTWYFAVAISAIIASFDPLLANGLSIIDTSDLLLRGHGVARADRQRVHTCGRITKARMISRP